MSISDSEHRSAARQSLDEQIAAEARKPPLDLPTDAPSSPLEDHPNGRGRPLAVAGIVENGVVRPVDPAVKLQEHTRVIIVTSDQIEDPAAPTPLPTSTSQR
jgi:hypothetical protein